MDFKTKEVTCIRFDDIITNYYYFVNNHDSNPILMQDLQH